MQVASQLKIRTFVRCLASDITVLNATRHPDEDRLNLKNVKLDFDTFAICWFSPKLVFCPGIRQMLQSQPVSRNITSV